ncbi:uncharacterized protein LOC116849990 isoform X2 [Odontomachus brunneus]|nr:uncharacterized protein LOC116849990 isoform X2 [Odontomachus brunneus]
MSSQLSKYKVRKYICDRCRHYFHSNEKLESHITDCQKLNDCAIILPTEDNKWLSFRNYSRKERIPFIVYSDLKCTLEKTAKNGEDHKSHTYQHHKLSWTFLTCFGYGAPGFPLGFCRTRQRMFYTENRFAVPNLSLLAE